MKFKEIRPGMVIHCPKEEDAEALLEHLEELGYTWAEGTPLSANNYWSNFEDGTCYWIYDSETIAYGNIRSAQDCNKAVTEFSDLIEPDDYDIDITGGKIRYGGNLSQLNNLIDDSPINSPMTAVEVLSWLKDNQYSGACEEIFHTTNAGYVIDVWSPEEIIGKITAYEAAKKAPKPVEVEKGYHCCLYGHNGLSIDEYILWGVDEQAAKDDVNGKAIQYTKDKGKQAYAIVDFTCRVKEDES